MANQGLWLTGIISTDTGRYLQSAIPSSIQFGNSDTADIILNIRESDNGIGLESNLEFDLDLMVASSSSGSAAIISQPQIHVTVLDPDGIHTVQITTYKYYIYLHTMNIA